MTKADFLEELRDMLQLEDDIEAETSLTDLEEWDSLAFMVLIAFFDKNFGQRITFQDLGACFTPEDIVTLSHGAIE